MPAFHYPPILFSSVIISLLFLRGDELYGDIFGLIIILGHWALSKQKKKKEERKKGGKKERKERKEGGREVGRKEGKREQGKKERKKKEKENLFLCEIQLLGILTI